MSQPLRFHVLLLPNVDWAEFLRRIRHVEELGFEVAALPDHLVDWTNPSAPWFEAWTSLAALAQATSTIRLSTLVTQIPLRNPAVLARQVLTTDHISAGRIELGLGTGLTIDPSYAMAGIDNWDNKERVDRFGEYLELVDLLLRQEVTIFHGNFYSADAAVMNPRPVQSPRPPIAVAAMAPRMMRQAVLRADIWNSLSFKQDVSEQLAETQGRCAAIDQLCAELGRDPANLRRSYTMFDGTARTKGGAIGYYDSPDAFVEQSSRFIELGMDEIGVYYPLNAAQVGVFERIATDALPILRAKYS